MKKTLLLLFIFFCIQNTNAQEPTKQETMDWIVAKIKKYINKDGSTIYFSFGKIITEKYNFISQSNDKIEFDYLINDDYKERTVIFLNKITSITSYEGAVIIYGDFIGNNIKTERLVIFNNMGGTHRGHWQFLNFENEEDLLNRFIKAIKLLAKYNTQSDKTEKF